MIIINNTSCFSCIIKLKKVSFSSNVPLLQVINKWSTLWKLSQLTYTVKRTSIYDKIVKRNTFNY
jgi:hypothetical protein